MATAGVVNTVKQYTERKLRRIAACATCYAKLRAAATAVITG
jgi:hypothetical protein